MYVAVKGGENAILNSYKLLAEQRRGDSSLSELSIEQIKQQLKLAVDRVMHQDADRSQRLFRIKDFLGSIQGSRQRDVLFSHARLKLHGV